MALAASSSRLTSLYFKTVSARPGVNLVVPDPKTAAWYARTSLASCRPEKPSVLLATSSRKAPSRLSSTSIVRFFLVGRCMCSAMNMSNILRRSARLGKGNSKLSSIRSRTARSMIPSTLVARTTTNLSLSVPVWWRKAERTFRASSLMPPESEPRPVRRKASASSMKRMRPFLDEWAQENNLFSSCTASLPRGPTSPPDMIA
mmetsp:Transcript_111395/g.315352  ORF Transcript_111395/g.315352 Transcript_111395/m.315352 type:complete len:203 (-) Transcript_111395:1168-1776(-)